MDQVHAVEQLRGALEMAAMLALPPLATALVVGLVIGVLQAATQVHEMTLAFVPKIVAVALVLWLMADLMLQKAITYGHEVLASISSLAGGD